MWTECAGGELLVLCASVTRAAEDPVDPAPERTAESAASEASVLDLGDDKITIRPFLKAREFHARLKELARIYERAYETLGGKYAYHGKGRIYSYLLWLYRGDPECFLVAWNGRNEPIGFISAHRHWHDSQLGEVGNIHEMDVDPDYQGKGIGKKLFETMLERLKREHQRVMLWVGEENHRARRMYERFGFREVGRHGEWVKMAKDFSND